MHTELQRRFPEQLWPLYAMIFFGFSGAAAIAVVHLCARPESDNSEESDLTASTASVSASNAAINAAAAAVGESAKRQPTTQRE